MTGRWCLFVSPFLALCWVAGCSKNPAGDAAQPQPGATSAFGEPASPNLAAGNAAAPTPKLPRYRFEAGKPYTYEIDIEVDLDDKVLISHANCTYSVAGASGAGGGTPAASAGDVFSLLASGYVNSHERTKQFTPGQGPPRPSMTTIGGPGKPVNIRVDSLGNVQEYGGGNLPSTLLGPIALMIFEPLPADGKQQWETHSESTLEIRSGEDTRGREDVPFAAGGFGPSGFGRSYGRGPMGSRFGSSPPREEAQVTRVPTTEATSYSWQAGTGDLATITKKYEWKTQGTSGQTPGYLVAGEGKMTFDTRLGLPKQMDFKGTLTLTKGNVSVKMPMTMKYALSDGTRPAATAAGNPRRSPNTPPKPDPTFVPVAQQQGKLAVRASGVEGNKTPDLAFDGNLETTWASGGHPVQWIEADLLAPISLESIQLMVAQLPDSETEHEIWVSDKPLGGERIGGKLAHTFRGFTKGYERLKFDFPAGTTARYVQVRTVESRSWVSWFEIEIRRQEK